jgi:hypothetical protein
VLAWTRTLPGEVPGVVAFVAAQYVLFSTGLAAAIYDVVVATNWLLILGGFMVVSWLATHLAGQARSAAGAYGAYGVFVLANALLFAAPLYQAETFVPDAITTAHAERTSGRPRPRDLVTKPQLPPVGAAGLEPAASAL